MEQAVAAYAAVAQTEASLHEDRVGWHELSIFQPASKGEETVEATDENSCCDSHDTVLGDAEISDEEFSSGAEAAFDGLRDLPELSFGKAVEEEVGDQRYRMSP